MFRGKERPSAMEFGACEVCNNGTRGADVLAAVMARLRPEYRVDNWQVAELKKLIPNLDRDAPGVRKEMSVPGKFRPKWARIPGSGLLKKVVVGQADGQRLRAYLTVFGAKMAMALYREHVGVALPLDGIVWTQFALNGGMTLESLNARIRILPGLETLRQGRKNVGDQFAYRYKTDERTVIAAVVEFHHSLWLTMCATCDPKIIDFFNGAEFLTVPASGLVRPGELLKLLPPPL
jgi:hypothetical protein